MLVDRINTIQRELAVLARTNVERKRALTTQIAETPNRKSNILIPLYVELRELQIQEVEVIRPHQFDLVRELTQEIMGLEILNDVAHQTE